MTPQKKYRLRASILREMIAGETDDCIEWPFCRMKSGYGRVHFQGAVEGTHRVSYILTHGSIPDGNEVCHRCDNPPCFNPRHLFAGTRQDNVDDRVSKGRDNPPCGQNHSRAKLTDDQVREIRATFVRKTKGKRGPGLKAFALRYGVSHGTIQRVIEGRGWRKI